MGGIKGILILRPRCDSTDNEMMVQLIVFLIFSFGAFSQSEIMTSLIEESENLKLDLKDQIVRAKDQAQKLADAQKKLDQYHGNDPKLKKILEDSVDVQKENLKFQSDGVIELKSMVQMKTSEIEERTSLLPQETKFTNCNEGTPEINLENEVPYVGANFKGPFYGVPRDNQDGLGTCFANTAKNLLVGLSKGRDVASFTDMALHYKDDSNLLASGIDGGKSCKTLASSVADGFCPQNLSPLERGEANTLAETLFKERSLERLATNIDLLRSFLFKMDYYQETNTPIKAEILSRAKLIIQKIQGNPGVTVPPPVMRFKIPSFSKLGQMYNNKKNGITVSDRTFMDDYESSYKKFYPILIKNLLQGEKLKNIFGQYEKVMKPFFSKYHLEKELRGIRRDFLDLAEEDYEKKDFQKNFKESLNLLKELTGHVSDSDEAFADYCGNDGYELFYFIDQLSPIMNQLRSQELNSEVLFDKDGKFKETSELMQLLIAPSCLHPQNRKKIDFPISCINGYDTIRKIKQSQKSPEEKIKALREKVVMSLVQGYPLGNAFQYSQDAAHINTVVGLRFDPKKKQCQYLIRESQTGTSSWLPEKQIFDKIEGLTEVRRR